MSQLSVYKHLAISNDRRLSSSLSNSSKLRRGSQSMGSHFSVNQQQKTKRAHLKTLDQQPNSGLPQLNVNKVRKTEKMPLSPMRVPEASSKREKKSQRGDTKRGAEQTKKSDL